MKELALLIALTTVVTAQEFEVASIRPARQDDSAKVDGDKGYYVVHNLTLKRLITMAWGVDGRDVIGGPNWISSDHWDIAAKMPAEYATRQQDSFLNPQDQFLRRMLQNLLADRFRLAIHREARRADGFALVVAKSGTKMAAANRDEDDKLEGGNRYLKGRNVTMMVLAKVLSDSGERRVVDKTGLVGGYDFELHWAPDDDPASDDPSISTALKEQLGLQLESVKLPIEEIIIDRAERPNQN